MQKAYAVTATTGHKAGRKRSEGWRTIFWKHPVLWYVGASQPGSCRCKLSPGPAPWRPTATRFHQLFLDRVTTRFFTSVPCYACLASHPQNRVLQTSRPSSKLCLLSITVNIPKGLILLVQPCSYSGMFLQPFSYTFPIQCKPTQAFCSLKLPFLNTSNCTHLLQPFSLSFQYVLISRMS